VEAEQKQRKNKNILNSLPAVIRLIKRNVVGNSENLAHPWSKNDLAIH